MASREHVADGALRPRLTEPAARHGRTALGVVVSVISLAAVGWWVSEQPAPTLPDTAAGLSWFGLAIVLALANMVLRGLRWGRIMTLAGIDYRRADAMALIFVGQMGNVVLPARGGDLMRIGLLGARSSSRRREILGSVLAERLLDAIVLVALFVLLSLGLADSPASPAVAALIGVALAAGFGGLAGYLWLRRSGRFERFAAAIRPVARACRLFAHPSGVLPVLLTVVIWCVDGMSLLLLARAVGEHLGVLDSMLVLVVASLAAAIPAAPGFAGTFDGAMVLALKGIGIVGSAAVGLLLLARFVFFVPSTVVGLIVLVARYGGFRRALRQERAAAG